MENQRRISDFQHPSAPILQYPVHGYEKGYPFTGPDTPHVIASGAKQSHSFGIAEPVPVS